MVKRSEKSNPEFYDCYNLDTNENERNMSRENMLEWVAQNVDYAVEQEGVGIDEILEDYIRVYPSGNMSFDVEFKVTLK